MFGGSNSGSSSGGGGGGGINSINGDSTSAQTIVSNASGSDFGIVTSAGNTTISLPVSSSTNTGKLAASDFLTFAAKVGGSGSSGQVSFWTGASTQSGDNGLFWDNINKRLGIGNLTPATALDIVGTETISGQILGGDGTASAPTYSFSSSNIGIYKSASTTLSLIANGTSGLSFTLNSTPTINTIGTTGLPTIRIQNQTLTPSGNDSSVFIMPTWASANFNFTTLSLLGTQSGANTQSLIGLNVAMTKATTATTLGTMTAVNIASPSVTGTVTTSSAITIQDQTSGSIGTSRGVVFSNTGPTNSIVWGNSALQYSNGANDVRFMDSTNVSGLDIVLSTTTPSINTTVTSSPVYLALQNQTLTPGSSSEAIRVIPTWTSANFTFRTLFINPTQQGANTSSLVGASVLIGQTGAGTIASAQGIEIQPPNIVGTITTNSGLFINNQSITGGANSTAIFIATQSANATTTRAMTINGTGAANAVAWGSSALQYANTTNNVRFTDSTNTDGLDFNLTTTNTTINTVTQDSARITLQNQTFTAGTGHSAVAITPQWTAENQQHTSLNVSATQNGANTSNLMGLVIGLTKATAATTLAAMSGLSINTPNVTGTVTAAQAILINNQTNGNITTTRGIVFNTAGVANSIVWGNSAIQYASTTNNITFADSTNVGGLSFSLTAAGNQSVTAIAGSVSIGSSVIFTAGQTANITSSPAGAYTILLTDFAIFKTGITGGGDTVTLPSAVTAGRGKTFIVKDATGTATVNNITINTSSGNIDGAATKVLNLNYGTVTVRSDGTNYFITG